MRQFIITPLCISLALVLLSLNGQGQDAPQRTGFHARRFLAKWVPEQGHWQVESNIHTPNHSVIYFFNEKDQMVYKEDVEGKRLNLKKKKTLLHLKAVLDRSIAAWQASHPVWEKGGMVAASRDLRVPTGD